MSFVFINILALFPPFLYSLAVPRISPVRGSPVPAASRTIQSSRPSVGDVRTLEFWVHFTHLSTQIGVRFEFVTDMPFFVFNNILASFVLFFVFFGPRCSPVPGLLRFSSWSGVCPRQCVRKMTTIIGYHVSLGLSSEKCESSSRTRLRCLTGPSHTTPRRSKCRPPARPPSEMIP